MGMNIKKSIVGLAAAAAVTAIIWFASSPIHATIRNLVDNYYLATDADAIVAGKSGIPQARFNHFATWVVQFDDENPETGIKFHLVTVCSQARPTHWLTPDEQKLSACASRGIRFNPSKGEIYEAMQDAAESLGSDFAHQLAVAAAKPKS